MRALNANIRCYRVVLLLLAGCAFFAPRPAYAADEGGELDAVAHTADGVYLDFAPFGTVELPRIFLRKDPWGLDVFSSTRSALLSERYVIEHEEDGHTELLRGAALHAAIEHHEHLYAKPQPVLGTMVLDLSITRHLVFGLLAALITVAVFVTLAQRYRRREDRVSAPRGIFQNMFEMLIVYVRDEIARPCIGPKYEQFVPFLLTAFTFILCCNLMGLVPYASAATSNISVTLVLAAFSFVVGQRRGTRTYWRHMFWAPGVPLPVKCLLAPIELVSLIAKHFALALRLFANMMSGSLLILSLIGIIFTINVLFGSLTAVLVAPLGIAFTLFISFIKIAVAFIHAFVFTLLSAIFFGMAVEEHHEDETHTEEQPALAG